MCIFYIEKHEQVFYNDFVIVESKSNLNSVLTRLVDFNDMQLCVAHCIIDLELIKAFIERGEWLNGCK